MLVDYLTNVLLFLEGRRLEEDALLVYQISVKKPVVFCIIDWEEFLRFEYESLDYVLNKDFKQQYLELLERELGTLDRLKTFTATDDHNKKRLDRKESVLQKIRHNLQHAVPDDNEFVKMWRNTEINFSPHRAWIVFIRRLAQALELACQIREGPVNDATEKEMCDELAALLTDLVCVNLYHFYGRAPPAEGV